MINFAHSSVTFQAGLKLVSVVGPTSFSLAIEIDATNIIFKRSGFKTVHHLHHFRLTHTHTQQKNSVIGHLVGFMYSYVGSRPFALLIQLKLTIRSVGATWILLTTAKAVFF